MASRVPLLTFITARGAPPPLALARRLRGSLGPRALAVLLAVAPAATAQEFRATISGTVVDSTGAALPGTTVTVTETRTGTKSCVASNSSGQYVVPFLAPGDYDLLAELSGFKQFARHAIHLAAGSHPIIDIRLEIGEV